MDNTDVLISSPLGVLAVLVFVAAFFFMVEQTTRSKLFQYLPPLLFIYATPVFLNNFDVIPAGSPVYAGLSAYLLPAFIVLMLIKVNVPAVISVMGKGVLVMLMGTAGVMVGAVVAYMLVHTWLSDDAWKGYGALAGSWIGGTANMAATAEMLGTSEEQFGLAVIADNVIYVVWLPLLLMSRDFADRFNKWARVPAERLQAMDAAADLHVEDEQTPTMPQYLFLAATAIGVTWFATALAPGIAGWVASVSAGAASVFSVTTVRILLVTTIALLLSVTPVSRLPNSTAMGTALIYIFVAGMGARASVAGLAEAPMFVAGAFIWILIHGLFCLAGAWLFRVDVHSVAIASAANIGAAASAPIVAAHHRPSLVPASILMALLGYAMGNYLAPLTGHLARMAVGQ
ncbi:MAG: DUF819 family protein [Gammaproteobacteria bacterium]|nr:DUF819 family protein [Gammaproteobacteria bacterium]MDH3352769.1 DUF819 family protein [Gammaproteobacteria bacterium]MDH3435119.1 DUF819 family protein [Gammaproteobacteria bacterium]